MPTDGPIDADDDRPRRPPSPATIAGVLALYAVALSAATYPYVTRLASSLPCGGDPPQHLWIMRWYKTCLLEGRSPLRCPDLQYPAGAPLGNFSPLHLQSLLYLPLSSVISNDMLCYNIIWIIGLLTTGLGTFLLARHVLRRSDCAALAGLLAMLSGPEMLHAHGHLELTYLGAFPLFLVAWLRFVDAPTRGRLAASAGALLLMTACAAYFVVLAAPAAALYVAWAASREGRRGVRPWLRGRWPWLAGFLTAVVPGLIVLFSGQLWAAARGTAMTRSRVEFIDHGAPLWGYVTPTYLHPLRHLLPTDPYAEAGYQGVRVGLIHDNASYLGLVTLGLLAYAAVARVRFRRAAFWWSALALLVVLSMGAYTTIGGRKIALPSLWLWHGFYPFRLIRSPARFNLMAAVVAAVIASAGLGHLLGRVPRRWPRAAIVAALALAAVADLNMVPYTTWQVAPTPACYAAVRRLDPHPTLLELPLQSSSFDLTGLDRTYWQSLHRCATSAGYSGVNNAIHDEIICANSPFPTWRPDFLARPGEENFGVVAGAGFLDYAWLFLTTHGYRFVVAHRPADPTFHFPEAMGRLRDLLRGAIVHEDAESVVFARDALPPPGRPVVVCKEGWRPNLLRPGDPAFGVGRVGRLSAYNPDPYAELTFWLRAGALHRARTARLLSGDRELARWQIQPGAPQLVASPPIRLAGGLQELRLETDGESRPTRSREALDESRRSYSLRVEGISLRPATPAVARAGVRHADRTR